VYCKYTTVSSIDLRVGLQNLGGNIKGGDDVGGRLLMAIKNELGDSLTASQ